MKEPIVTTEFSCTQDRSDDGSKDESIGNPNGISGPKVREDISTKSGVNYNENQRNEASV